MRFLAQLVRLPIAALAYGVDVLVNTMQESQREAKPPRAVPPAGNASSHLPPIYKETNEMADQDLSADELKVVRYRIIFKKRDLEVTLHAAEELVSYDTDGASFGALKISELMIRIAQGKVPRPAKWREEKYGLERDATKWEIPEQDRRYIGFLYEVIRREPREEKEYDRAQIKELKHIAEEIRQHRSK